MKISGVYKITNTITGDFYIGSSKNVKLRLACHKCPYTWNEHPNIQLYQDIQKYGVDKFDFEVIAETEPKKLKEVEQQFIEKLKPIYNNRNANGWDFERYKETKKEYQKSDKYKEYQKEYQVEYNKSDKGKETHRKASNKYNNQLCYYNGETLTLCALSTRFRRKGLSNPVLEAKKYLLYKDL